MRKIVTLSMVAAASLALAACGKSETPAADNPAATELNAADAMEGTTNDAMTNVDAATGADAEAGRAIGAAALEDFSGATGEWRTIDCAEASRSSS